MTRTQSRRFLSRRGWAWAAAALTVLAVCVYLRSQWGPDRALAQGRSAAHGSRRASAEAQQQPETRAQRSAPTDVMAKVNGQPIERQKLAAACIERHGKEVLESLVNKRLIMHHCRNRGIQISQEELAREIDRMAERFKLGREQWLELLQNERGIAAEQYARDIVWPTLALRKLSADELTVSEQELQERHVAEYGEAVRARLIVVDNETEARQLHRQLLANPDDFARLAIEKSQDVNSASIGGLIQPIRHHVGDPTIETEVFQLADGAVSRILRIGNQYAILRRISAIPAQQVALESVRDQLTEKITEAKLRDVSQELFAQLQASATIVNVLNDPHAGQRMPGVVATVNAERITFSELQQECILRYGKQVLESEIARALLSQALKDQNLRIGDEDLQAEIAHAAQLAGVVDENGDPNMEAWFKLATEQQQITRDNYLRDSVWPSAALKKLTQQDVRITQKDLSKAFEANYGERVRCHAIVLGNLRRAQKVWALARQDRTLEYFGDLAAEYSIDQTSKSLRGEVPPIRRFGGQPRLEDVAFGLQPGELSGIVQVADKFVILRCAGRTKPVKVDFAEVREILERDIFEKKLRLAMSEKFEQLRSAARIDNYLAGTSQAPRAKRTAGGRVPQLELDRAVRPAAARR